MLAPWPAEGAHAGICLETPGPINAAMERIIDLPVQPPDPEAIPLLLACVRATYDLCMLRRGCVLQLLRLNAGPKAQAGRP